MLNRRFFISFSAVAVVLLIALFSIREQKPIIDHKNVQVYECLELDNSIDDLNTHLKAHSSYVDRFVFLECGENNQGGSKELIYPNLKSKMATYSDKIIYVVTPKLPQTTQEGAKEFYYKNQYLKAFDECKDTDIIIFSDAKSELSSDKFYQAFVSLEQNPDQVLFFKGKSNEQNVKISTYKHVKQALPATIEKSSKLSAHRLDWKSFFFPIKEQPR